MLILNEYEVVYQIKEDIEKKISENKLFKLSVEEATFIVLEKVGVLFSIYHRATFENKQEHLKDLIKTNRIKIDDISFFQESVKWIFRWCSQYCGIYSQIDKKEVRADDVFDLMGIAYSYEEFYRMWDLHRAKIIKYSKIRNKITFDYKNEEVYKIHVVYDTFFREINNFRQCEELNLIGINKENIEKLMSHAHQMDFNCSFDIEFEGFNLEEYKIFSTELTRILTQTMLSNVKRGMIIPGKEGILCLKKEEWIEKLSLNTGLDYKKVSNIMKFFTYDFSSSSSDISLTYFVPHSNDYLAVSEAIFNLSRPEANAMRLLAKKRSASYERAQNNFEDEQKSEIQKNINQKYLIPVNLDKSKKIRPGMDLLVYDEEKNHLQIIELKYKIPVESTWDIKNLDSMLDKAYKQVNEAKIYTNKNLSLILNEYFGEHYKDIIPNKIDFFILTNYSIGTGMNVSLPTPILLIDHYIKLMDNNDGMEQVRKVINKNDKMLQINANKRYSRFSLLGNKILIPDYSFKLSLEKRMR